MKKILLLGATGSIGTQVLEVIDTQKDEFKVESISVGNNITRAIEIIEKYHPKYVSTKEEKDYIKLRDKYTSIEFGYGEEGLVKAATFASDALLINAVVGMVGLLPTIAAIKNKETILLANKETLVVAGELIKKLVKENNVKLIPIDSEHSAISQCLKGRNKNEINKIIITASGGSFRDKTREELENVTLQDALHHPNWSMGKKITVDSATMVNKGLEVIEAHFLFDVDYDNIHTIIHKESIIHSMVEFKDKTIIAQMSYPDMRIPIQYAMFEEDKKDFSLNKSLDLELLKSLSFYKTDLDRFPCLALAYRVGKMGGVMPAVFNASNEAAVNLFIDGKIKFLEIEKIIFDYVNKIENIINPTFEQIIMVDKKIKEDIFKHYQ